MISLVFIAPVRTFPATALADEDRTRFASLPKVVAWTWLRSSLPCPSMRPTLTSRRKPWRGGTFLCFASTARLSRTRQSTGSVDCVDALSVRRAYLGRTEKSRAGQMRGVPSGHAQDELIFCAQLGLNFVMVVVIVGQGRVNLRQCQLGQRLDDVVNAFFLVHVSRNDLRNLDPRATNVRATATDVRQHVDVAPANMGFSGCAHECAIYHAGCACVKEQQTPDPSAGTENAATSFETWRIITAWHRPAPSKSAST